MFKVIILQSVYLNLVPSHKSKHTSSTRTEEVRMKITRVFSCRMNELSSDSIFVFWLEGTQHHLFHIRGFFSSSSKTTCWQFWTETTVTDLILMLLAFFLEYHIMYRIMNYDYELRLRLWLWRSLLFAKFYFIQMVSNGEGSLLLEIHRYAWHK